MKKLANYLLIILLIISTIPANSYQTFAEELNAPVEKEAVLFADKESDEVEFYETVPEKEMEPFLMISDDTEVILLIEENEEEQPDNEDEYLYIRYVLIDEEIEDVEKQETTYEGYVHHSNVVLKEDADTYRDNRSEEVDEEDSNEEENSNQEDESHKEAPNQKEDPEAEKVEDQEDKQESVEDKEQENKEELDETEKQEEGKEEQDQQEDEAVKEPDDKTLKSESKSSRSLSLSSNDEIKNGDRDKKVIQLKKDLATLGFPVPGNGTSLFGKETQKQVKAFQKYYNITVTGTLNAETETKIKKVLSTPLQKGKRHKDTKQLKKDLAYIGMPVPGNGTTLYGKDTEKVVKKFQKKYKLVQSGIAEEITLAKLKELKDTPLKNGMRREDVKTLKRNLAKLGFKVPGKGTTLFGKETEKQVKAFQKYYGLSQTGTVNKSTDKKINEVLSSPLQKGKRHKDTKKLKKDLAYIGMPVPGNGTTLYGKDTEKTVKKFQKKYKLVQSGIAEEITLAKLKELKDTPLKNGMRREDVKTLKKNLAKLGFAVPGNGTTLFGKETEKQVKAFQKYYGLSQTGTVNKTTDKKINEVLSSPLQKGKRHKDTQQLKKDLKRLGFKVPGNGTTLYGAQTEKQVKAFQKYYKLKTNGIADQPTLKKIKQIKSHPLQNGKRHKNTKQLKKDLAKIGYTVPGNGTTLFGKETEKKVKQFQKDHKLPVSGIAEDTTLAKIAQLVKNEDSKPSKPVNKTEYTNYNLTLNQALDIQMSRPTIITDKYSNDPAYISADYLDFKVTTKSKANVRTSAKTGNNIALKLKNGTPIKISGKTTGSKISGSKVWYRISYKGLKYYIHSSMVNASQAFASTNVNVRSNKNSKSHIFGLLKKGQSISVTSHGSWHQVSYGTWRNPTRSDMKGYLDPSKNDKFQHLRLDSTVGVSAKELNKVLKGKGILAGEGQAFINGANKHGVNEAYLMSHAFLETGNGTSTLAKGVKYKGKTVYNMFGIGAVDSDPINGGAKTAYENGWFTPAKAIEGGAKWIGDGYIYNEHKQNTLYKMRWNPRMSEGYAWKQYATDIAWATKQVSQIKDIYSQLKNPNHHFDIPKYK